MSRFFVPAVIALTISGLALVLIWGIVARSPETHANVRPEGFDRTPIAYVGEVSPFEGLRLADPGLITSAGQVEGGRLIFFDSGCAACHGLSGQGGVVGPALDLDELSSSEFRRAVRNGPKGMPSFLVDVLSDEDLEKIYAFLDAVRRGEGTATSNGPEPAPGP